jgi:hypothetical protein
MSLSRGRGFETFITQPAKNIKWFLSLFRPSQPKAQEAGGEDAGHFGAPVGGSHQLWVQ